jgi:hypothetical protein
VFRKYKIAIADPRRSPLTPLKKLPYIHISKKSEISENPPNPLKKGAKIGLLVPLFKGDLGGLRSRNEVKQTCVYTVA